MDSIEMSERGENYIHSDAAASGDSAGANNISVQQPTPDDEFSRVAKMLKEPSKTEHEHFWKLANFAPWDNDYKLSKAFPDLGQYLILGWSYEIQEKRAAFHQEILCNGSRRRELELGLRKDFYEYCRFSNVTGEFETKQRPVDRLIKKYLEHGKLFPECNKDGLFEDEADWRCRHPTDQRQKLVRGILEDTDSRFYKAIQKILQSTTYGTEPNDFIATFSEHKSLAVLEMASHLAFTVWLVLPVPLFALNVVSRNVKVIMFIVFVLFGYFTFCYLYPGSPHAVVATLAYGAFLGTAIFGTE